MNASIKLVSALSLSLIATAACSQRSAPPVGPITPYSSIHSAAQSRCCVGPPANPNGLVLAGKELYVTTENGGSHGHGAVVGISLSGKARTVYNIWKGLLPEAAVLPLNGELYTTTSKGGEYHNGTIFAVDATTGILKFSYGFKAANDGAMPDAPLVNVDGVLYGTTWGGGATQNGTIFEVTPSGQETVLYAFQGGSDGRYPASKLTYHGGVFYGATPYGGSACGSIGCGTIFTFDPATGAEAPLYQFQGGNDGSSPNGALFVNGKIYGVTGEAGAYNAGTLYAVDPPTGTETPLYSFGGTNGDGLFPSSSLIDVNGVLYGVTAGGGLQSYGTVYSYNLSTQQERVLHAFGVDDGNNPTAPLIRVGSLLYGTTLSGGKNNRGTIFTIDMSGNEKVFYNF